MNSNNADSVEYACYNLEVGLCQDPAGVQALQRAQRRAFPEDTAHRGKTLRA